MDSMKPVMTMSRYITLCTDGKLWYIVDNLDDKTSIPYDTKLAAYEAWRLGKVQYKRIAPV